MDLLFECWCDIIKIIKVTLVKIPLPPELTLCPISYNNYRKPAKSAALLFPIDQRFLTAIRYCLQAPRV